MKDLLPEIEQWRGEGQPVALCTVVKVEGSAPRREGATLVVTEDGRMAGSVSGGCLEADVVLAAQEVLANGQPRLLHYGISDEMAWNVGLACGGTVDVFIEPLNW